MPTISHVGTFADLSAALLQAKHIIVLDIIPIEANLVVPADLTLEFVRGGGFAINPNVALTIHARLEAGPYPIFWGIPQGKPQVDWILPEWFRTNATTDFRPALAACNAAFIAASPRRLRIGADINVEDTVSLENWDEIDAPGTIMMVSGELHLSHIVTQTVPVRWHLREIWRAQYVGDQVVLVLKNLKNADVTVGSSSGVRLLAHAAVTEGAIAYSRFNWGEVNVLEIVTVKEPGPAQPWINENIHIGGRFHQIYIGGAYDSNNNIFLKPCVEGGVIRISRGIRNIFRDVRTEGGTLIVFEVDAHHNEVHELEQWPGVAVVQDHGRGNVVLRPDQRELERVPLCTLTCESPMTESMALGQLCRESTWGDEPEVLGLGVPEVPSLGFKPGALVPGTSRFGVTAYTRIVDTGLIPIAPAVQFWIASEADQAWMRVAVRVYDADRSLLIPAFDLPGVVFVGGDWRTHYDGAQKNCYHHQANVLDASFYVQLGSVHYVRISVLSGNISGVQPVRSLSIAAAVDRNRGTTAGERGMYPVLREIRGRFERPLLSPGASSPTAGFFEIGERVHRKDGLGSWKCVVSRKLTGTWNGTEISVAVGTLTGLQSDDIIGLESDDGLMYWSKVSAINGSAITIAGNPGLAASAKARMVYIARWAVV